MMRRLADEKSNQGGVGMKREACGCTFAAYRGRSFLAATVDFINTDFMRFNTIHSVKPHKARDSRITSTGTIIAI